MGSGKNLLRIPTTRVLINLSFTEISEYFGYNPVEYAKEIAELVQQWSDQGYVEVYEHQSDKAHGRIKPSDKNSQGKISPFYIGLYHARVVNNDNDPLVVLKIFDDDIEYQTDESTQCIDLRFLISHEDFFGSPKIKRDPTQLREIWKEVNSKVILGDK